MTLEKWGALAAILTFLGGVALAVKSFVALHIRKWKIEKFLIDRRRERVNGAIESSRRYVGQIAVELGLTADQVYDAASRSTKLERGSDGADPTRVWFTARDAVL